MFKGLEIHFYKFTETCIVLKSNVRVFIWSMNFICNCWDYSTVGRKSYIDTIYIVASLSNQDIKKPFYINVKQNIVPISMMQVKNAIDSRIKLVNLTISNISILSSAITFNHIFYKLFKHIPVLHFAWIATVVRRGFWLVILYVYYIIIITIIIWLFFMRKETNTTHKIYQNSKMILNRFINMRTLLRAYRISVELLVHSLWIGY